MQGLLDPVTADRGIIEEENMKVKTKPFAFFRVSGYTKVWFNFLY